MTMFKGKLSEAAVSFALFAAAILAVQQASLHGLIGQYMAICLIGVLGSAFIIFVVFRWLGKTAGFALIVGTAILLALQYSHIL